MGACSWLLGLGFSRVEELGIVLDCREEVRVLRSNPECPTYRVGKTASQVPRRCEVRYNDSRTTTLGWKFPCKKSLLLSRYRRERSQQKSFAFTNLGRPGL